MRFIRKIFIKIVLLWASAFFIFGCGSSYDKGYDDGWEGSKDNFSSLLSESYRDGYEAGADDAYFFDLGCSDASSENQPEHPDIQEYMKGYGECS